MTRKLLWWLLMCLLLISIVWLISNNQGYVLIVRSPYRVQLSFNFLLVVGVLIFLAIHYSLRLIHYLRRLPANRRSKKETQRLIASNAALLEGMHALADGDFEKAEIAVKRAHDLIQNAGHEKLLEALASEKSKQDL
ncbi:putative protoheme IX biogenesis protein [mine drainage metagenome]|uniref:Putative protoheme IX biogenesis protein n=1 Tax=mine drainage metagenome TaxID=410659 RepID=A0A1J5RME1_9ZZZZ